MLGSFRLSTITLFRHFSLNSGIKKRPLTSKDQRALYIYKFYCLKSYSDFTSAVSFCKVSFASPNNIFVLAW